MAKTVIGEDEEPAKKAPARGRRAAAPVEAAPVPVPMDADPADAFVPAAAPVAAPEAVAEPAARLDAGEVGVDAAPPPWGALTVAVIDDAMHLPRLDRLSDQDATAVGQLLEQNAEVKAELTALGCVADASPDEQLRALAESGDILASIAMIGGVSADAQRMIEEHRTFRRLMDILEHEVHEVTICDPYQALPDLTAHNLILLDYYLNGPSKGGDLAVQVATNIRGQAGRAADQQIVLMSSLEGVRELRGQFRSETDLAGSAFAFIGKPDLNEAWKVKAHLGMLERARPYAPAFTEYRTKLAEALAQAREDLLALVDDLDIGDYAFLQSRALMKDGHPLGDYVFWLLSSQLMALAFERDEMRERQRTLDMLEFVGEPFAATEPSTIVANLLHSALVSRNMGALGPHPRAKPGSAYANFPLVQLGDVFLDTGRTKAVVVMSADCDLAFSPMEERAPDAETPVMLVPGKPIKLKDAREDADANTDGLLHREEVYRIVWDFAKYRAVPLGNLEDWLKREDYDVSNRDRLRPLFGLKLQQEFGAHLMRVGPPVLPPMTNGATGRVLICTPDQEEVAQFTASELMLTRFKKLAWIRVTPRIAGMLKQQCEELLLRLEEKRDQAPVKKKPDFTKKIDNLTTQLANDDFWIEMLNGVELNAPGSVKTVGPLGFVLGTEWTDAKVRVMLEIRDETAIDEPEDQGETQVPVEEEADAGAVSGAA